MPAVAWLPWYWRSSAGCSERVRPPRPGEAGKPADARADASAFVGRALRSEGMLRQGATVIPASLITLAHFGISCLIRASNASGVLPTGSFPSAVMRAAISGDLTIFTIA